MAFAHLYAVYHVSYTPLTQNLIGSLELIQEFCGLLWYWIALAMVYDDKTSVVDLETEVNADITGTTSQIPCSTSNRKYVFQVGRIILKLYF